MEHQAGTPSTRHAVVIGGSIAGLFSARVLLNHFDRVTLIERDALSPELSPPDPTDSASFRAGVPQSRHVHVLLTQGQRVLEQFFPGITADLTAAGAPSINWTADWRMLGLWGWFPRVSLDIVGVACSRVLLERFVFQRLQAHPQLTLLTGAQVQGLVTDAGSSRVTGVTVKQRNQPESFLEADLVVDASGRNSALPDWLKAIGYESPQETVINAFLGYATRWYRKPPNFQADWKGITLAPHPSQHTRGGTLYPVEGDRWIVTLGGMAAEQAPTDEAEFLEFARSLRDSSLYDAICQAEPLSPVYGYRRTENCWRHYERLKRLPDGLVAVGDAVCAFNPVYGQGMTVAALGASLLDQWLGQGAGKPGSLRFQQRLARVIANPWSMATAEDCRWPTTEGPRPNGLAALVQRYGDQVLLLATERQDVFETFVRVVHLIEPPTALFQPRIASQVLASFFDQRLRTKMRAGDGLNIPSAIKVANVA
jgi:2-polyprenyl-6-methoxyphenol hydroxylase-like FAD-dependent oxidoreductase